MNVNSEHGYSEAVTRCILTAVALEICTYPQPSSAPSAYVKGAPQATRPLLSSSLSSFESSFSGCFSSAGSPSSSSTCNHGHWRYEVCRFYDALTEVCLSCHHIQKRMV